MARITVSCCITPEQNAFAAEKRINLSGILQDSLDRMMESALSPAYVLELKEENERLSNNMRLWRDKALILAESLRARGFAEDVDKTL